MIFDQTPREGKPMSTSTVGSDDIESPLGETAYPTCSYIPYIFPCWNSPELFWNVSDLS